MLKSIFNFIFEVYIMFLVFGISIIVYAFSYLVPKYGVEMIIAAVAFVSFTRIQNKFRKKKEK